MSHTSESRRVPRSVIYEHFTKIGNTRMCRHCNMGFIVIPGSTRKLHYHLKFKHPTLISPEIANSQHNVDSEEMEDASSDDSSSSGDSSDERSRHELTLPPVLCRRSVPTQSNSNSEPSTQEKYDKQLVRFICADYHPFSIVENVEFKAFVKALNPDYAIPNKQTLSSIIFPTVYKEKINIITKMLDGASSVCLSFDGWVNPRQLYGLTAHFIDKQTKLHSLLVAIDDFTGRYCVEAISSWIKSVAETYLITNKIDVIISGDIRTVKEAAERLNYKHILCFGHSIDFAVQVGIDAVPTFDKLKRIIHLIIEKPDMLREMQKKMKRKRVKLVRYVPTRWNSMHEMLVKFLENQEPIIALLEILNPDLSLSQSELAIIQESALVLEIFCRVSLYLSDINSMPKITLLYDGIQQALEDLMQEITSDEVKNLSHIIMEELRKCFERIENQELIAEVAFLDPRFKITGFNETMRETVYQSIVEQVKSLICISKTEKIPTENVEESELDIFFKGMQEKHDEMFDPNTIASNEVNCYLSSEILERSSDPILWWEERKKAFPELYSLAMKRLCIPATTVPFAKIFSNAERMCADKGNRLTPKRLLKMIFIHNNNNLPYLNTNGCYLM